MKIDLTSETGAKHFHDEKRMSKFVRQDHVFAKLWVEKTSLAYLRTCTYRIQPRDSLQKLRDEKQCTVWTLKDV